jgi:type VI secretion system FHA domain protein
VGLILEIVSSSAEHRPSVTRKVFGPAGGTIGRATHSDWVLPNNKVSSRHAKITCENSTFFIEDTSRNGIYLNSPDNRLELGQRHPLKAGDRLLVEPYEILVSITSDRDDTRRRPIVAAAKDAGDPFKLDDLFGRAPLDSPPPATPGLFEPLPESNQDAVVDPLILLGAAPKAAAPPNAPSVARDLELGNPLDAHFRPPAVVVPPVAALAPTPAVVPAGPPVLIPDNYDPLAPDTRSVPPEVLEALAHAAPAAAPAMPIPDFPALDFALPLVVDADPAPAVVAPVAPAVPPVPSVPPASHAPPVPVEAPGPRPAGAMAAASTTPVSADLAGVLAAAGLGNVAVTPELAEQFGQILRVVVQGVMDVMRSRQQVKDEFRMRMTYFMPVDNNPLKFSANADDALHNLLVKRNEAYLGPVEAFEEAFDDLRKHQLAVLAGMRVAFESTLAEFDPDRLQEDFDRQLKKSAVFSVGAKMKYWDLFRERREEIDKDPEESFRSLFGEAFTRAYDAQLKRLKDEHGRR